MPPMHQLDYLRNRIRHQVLPLLATLNPQITPALGRTATLMADAARVHGALDSRESGHTGYGTYLS